MGLLKDALSANQRAHIAKKNFGVPAKAGNAKAKKESGNYPIEDMKHARAALSYGSRFLSPAAYSRLKARIHKKYPSLGKESADMMAQPGAGQVPLYNANAGQAENKPNGDHLQHVEQQLAEVANSKKSEANIAGLQNRITENEMKLKEELDKARDLATKLQGQSNALEKAQSDYTGDDKWDDVLGLKLPFLQIPKTEAKDPKVPVKVNGHTHMVPRSKVKKFKELGLKLEQAQLDRSRMEEAPTDYLPLAGHYATKGLLATSDFTNDKAVPWIEGTALPFIQDNGMAAANAIRNMFVEPEPEWKKNARLALMLGVPAVGGGVLGAAAAKGLGYNPWLGGGIGAGAGLGAGALAAYLKAKGTI